MPRVQRVLKVSSKSVHFQFVFGSGAKLAWGDFEPISNRFRTDSEPISNRFRTDFEPNPNRSPIRTDFEPISNRFRTDFEPISNRFRTDFEPVTKLMGGRFCGKWVKSRGSRVQNRMNSGPWTSSQSLAAPVRAAHLLLLQQC